MRLKIILTFLISLLPLSAIAADYYVDEKITATLNESDDGPVAFNNAQSIETPCSAGTAMANAVAGDTVYFRGGIYELGQSNDNDSGRGVLNPANSGSAGNPITFKRYQNEVPQLVTTVTIGYGSRAMGNFWQSYITIDGFTVSSHGTNGTNGYGQMSIGGNPPIQVASNVIIQNCTFMGAENPIDTLDNLSGISMGPAGAFGDGLPSTTNCTIRNNRFDDYTTTAGSYNTASIELYSAHYLTVANNEFINSNVGMYSKYNNKGITIKNNFIIADLIGINVACKWSDQSDGTMTNNIVTGFGIYGIELGQDGVTDVNIDNWVISNNTIYSNNTAIRDLGFGLGSDRYVYNNILNAGYSQTFFRVNDQDTFVSELTESDHNMFSWSSFSIQKDPNSYMSIDLWQASSELVGGGSPGVGSLFVPSPIFVNTSGTFAEIDDFMLDTGSPAIASGRDGVDMGADISLVGVQPLSTTSTIQTGSVTIQ